MEATFSVGGYPVTFTPYMAVPPEGGESVYCLRVDSPSGEFRGLIFDILEGEFPYTLRQAEICLLEVIYPFDGQN